MKWLWTWDGRCFGYLDDDNLWTYGGHHVGKFFGSEVYGSNGRYLGEILNDRLITNISKKSYVKPSFTPYATRGGYAKCADYAGYAMYAGYEDFPHLEE